MPLDAKLLEVLVCPQCKAALSSVEGGHALVCEHCELRYPVREGVPVLLIEESLDLRSSKSKQFSSTKQYPRVKFKIIEGPDVNMLFEIEYGTCRAIGRGSIDTNKTTIFNVDIALALDDDTKSLVLQYIARQFKKHGKQSVAGEVLGQFRRAPDVVLTDSSLSRLHAMMFADESGVGILDLVSKNGTFINGAEIESYMLKKGDLIELGETTISFEG